MKRRLRSNDPKLDRWLLTEFYRWRSDSNLWTGEGGSSIPFFGLDDYLMRLHDIDVPDEMLLPLFDFKAEQQKEREKASLKRWLVIGFVSLIWALTFLAVTFALKILRG